MQGNVIFQAIRAIFVCQSHGDEFRRLALEQHGTPRRDVASSAIQLLDHSGGANPIHFRKASSPARAITPSFTFSAVE